MTHAEKIREAERRVIEAAKACTANATLAATGWALANVVAGLLALESETCPECGGTGNRKSPISRERCPAACDSGRRRAE